MNELVYLNDEDYHALIVAVDSSIMSSSFCSNIPACRSQYDAVCRVAEKLTRAHDEGLLMSFDVKKVKVRRARR